MWHLYLHICNSVSTVNFTDANMQLFQLRIVYVTDLTYHHSQWLFKPGSKILNTSSLPGTSFTNKKNGLIEFYRTCNSFKNF